MYKVIYAQEKFPLNSDNTWSIFLAGPTPRNKNILSWRKEALKYIDEYPGFEGIVYNPEPIDVEAYKDYDRQMEWEHEALNRASLILFYIPRNLSLDENGKLILPGFTTNIEFGLYAKSNKIVVCIPEEYLTISSNTYIQKCCKKFNIPFMNSLQQTIRYILSLPRNNLYERKFISNIQQHLDTAIEQLCKLRKLNNDYKQYGQLLGDSISDISEVVYILNMINDCYKIGDILDNLR